MRVRLEVLGSLYAELVSTCVFIIYKRYLYLRGTTTLVPFVVPYDGVCVQRTRGQSSCYVSDLMLARSGCHRSLSRFSKQYKSVMIPLRRADFQFWMMQSGRQLDNKKNGKISFSQFPLERKSNEQKFIASLHYKIQYICHSINIFWLFINTHCWGVELGQMRSFWIRLAFFCNFIYFDRNFGLDWVIYTLTNIIHDPWHSLCDDNKKVTFKEVNT